MENDRNSILIYEIFYSLGWISSFEKNCSKVVGGVREFREYFSSDHSGAAAAFCVILGFITGSPLEETREEAY